MVNKCSDKVFWGIQLCFWVGWRWVVLGCFAKSFLCQTKLQFRLSSKVMVRARPLMGATELLVLVPSLQRLPINTLDGLRGTTGLLHKLKQSFKERGSPMNTLYSSWRKPSTSPSPEQSFLSIACILMQNQLSIELWEKSSQEGCTLMVLLVIPLSILMNALVTESLSLKGRRSSLA